MKRLLVGAWTLAMVLSIMGCGGGGSSSSNMSNASATISKAEYVKQADVICGRTEKKQLQLVGSFGATKPTRQGQIELIEYAGIPPLQQQAKELSELPAPNKGEAEAKAYIVAFSAGVKESEEDPGALIGAAPPFAKAQALAAKFGFKVCGGA